MTFAEFQRIANDAHSGHCRWTENLWQDFLRKDMPADDLKPEQIPGCAACMFRYELPKAIAEYVAAVKNL